MARTTTARWTLPLTALLFVNTVLVALAARHVGLIPEPTAALAEGSVAIEETGTLDKASPALAPQTYAGVEPQVEAGSQATPIVSEAIDVKPAVAEDWMRGELVVTSDAAGTAVANRDDAPSELASPKDDRIVVDQVFSDPPREPSAARPVDTTPAPGVITPEQPPSPYEFLTFVNPPAAGGVVHFVIDGKVISLAPGELCRLQVADERLVEFHRGDAFGDAEHRCQFGVYAFAVGDAGWTLGEVGGSLAARLLKICRPIAAGTEADCD